MKLAKLLARVDVAEPGEIPDLEITAPVTDSRSVKPGGLFIAVKGVHADGHAFIADAVKNGAAAVVADASHAVNGDIPVPVIRVRDSRRAAAFIHSANNGDPADGMSIIAVTGTNGKTSVTFILRSILKSAGRRVGLIGTVRILMPPEPGAPADTPDKELAAGGSELYGAPSAMTTPDPAVFYAVLAEMKRRKADVVIIEATSHALALDKLAPIAPALAIFTNLTPEHLDYHGTMDAYLRAKAKLFAMSPRAVTFYDDPAAAEIEKLAPDAEYIRCTLDGGKTNINCDCGNGNSKCDCGNCGCDSGAVGVKSLGADGVEYIFKSKRTIFRVRCPIPGDYTVVNTLLAIRAALEFGIDPVVIQDSVRFINGVDGRLERVRLDATKADFAVFIDYAHTPAALENMLVTVRRFTENRLLLVFGCGGDRDREKRPLMGSVASRLADFTVITSDNCRTEPPNRIIDDIMNGFDRGKPHIIVENRGEAITRAVQMAKRGDVVVLAGKGHEKYEIDADGKRPFDEAELAKAALRGIGTEN